MSNEPIQSFFTDLRDTHMSGVGVKETSYYTYLANLLNALGKKLKPRVRCIIHPHSVGAGLPDGALITTDQKSSADDPLASGLIPARGVIEIKDPSADAHTTAQSEQLTKYLDKYGLVLVTNLRQYILIARVDGHPKQLETFTLAPTAKAFWKALDNPAKFTEQVGASFFEYLMRVLLQNAPLSTPKEVAWFLASYARDAKARIEAHPDLPGLAALRSALEEALGLKFTGDEGEHFFRSSLVQTLFYGVFSAWVLWSKRPTTGPNDKFNWHEAAWSLHVPMIRTLFENLATPSKLQSLQLEDVLNWTETALNRVQRGAFFSNFEEKHAVQYFYEPFLAAYDPVLRKRLGVWFTPPEIVQYMVARVDDVLRKEMGVPSGLADPTVLVLDPCCGTGAFLVEVLRRIEATLKEEGGDALTAEDVKSAAIERVFGFELLPAPFVVSHLQLGLLLQDMGAPLSEMLNERVGVYLTNALTGWNPPTGPKQTLMWPELEEERDAAELVKRDKKILVVLGNPPYYAFSGVSPEEEQGLVEPYKEGLLSEWKIKKYNLDELYVRFLRLAERRIAEMSNRGIVCYISSYSYLSDPSFVVVRKRFCEEFDYAWIDCLNGDSRETGKLTPDDLPDPSVFSTEYNKEGIRLGTTVGLFAKTTAHTTQADVRYREFWGADKRALLLKTLKQEGDWNAQYKQVQPAAENRFSFRPLMTGAEYSAWPLLVTLAKEEPISGLQEMRRGALMAYEKESLQDRMKTYFDPEVDWNTFAALQTGLSKPAGMFTPESARTKLLGSETYSDDALQRYALYPLDNRWCYYSEKPPLWNRPRPELLAQREEGEPFVILRRFAERPREGRPAMLTSVLPDYHLLRPNIVAIPLRLSGTVVDPETNIGQGNLYADHAEPTGPTANLSEQARAYLATLTPDDPDQNAELARAPWFHALAIIYSTLYLSEYSEPLRSDWPRIPMPASLERLQQSAALGAYVGTLVDVEKPVLGVTGGKVRKEIATLGKITGPKGLSLAITVGWGHLHKEKDLVMPGRGRQEKRNFTEEEITALSDGAAELGLTLDQILTLWGGFTYDIYLNDETHWKNVPASVWEYTIGGYQVLKKWLSYRDANVIGREITKDEARAFTHMVRRIAALVLSEPELDNNYIETKANTYKWPISAAPSLAATDAEPGTANEEPLG